MRFIYWLALIAIALPISGFGQTAQKTIRTISFSNSNGEFRIVYPKDLQICMQGAMDPCNRSYIRVCEPDALVCVVYRDNELKGTGFDVASFQAREIFTEQETMTADVCATPYPQKTSADSYSGSPEFMISAEHPAETISGVKFVHGINGGAALGHWSSIDLYRAFQEQKCIELSVTETGINVTTDPPLKPLTPVQLSKLNRTMSDMLHSFRIVSGGVTERRE